MGSHILTFNSRDLLEDNINICKYYQDIRIHKFIANLFTSHNKNTETMATNSVRRLFIDTQQRVVAASASSSVSASSKTCSCNSWSGTSSSSNPPITMMARFVREDSKSSSNGSSSGGGWNKSS